MYQCLRKKKWNQKGGGWTELSLHSVFEDQSSIHIKHVFRSVGNSGAHFAVCFFINPLF